MSEQTITSARNITPFLWFDQNAGEAVDFYLSVFPNSKRTGGANGPGGNPMTIAFELNGQAFTAINGGPMFKFSEAVSFVISCNDQAEIDSYWSKLTSGGGLESHCGWLKDKFGLSWQVVPRNMPELMKSRTAMQAFGRMSKIDIATLEAAASA